MLKNLKLGFAAIIAVLAISATLASYAGAFENTNLSAKAITCYRFADAIEAPNECGTVDLCFTNFTIPVAANECVAPLTVGCCYLVDDTQICPTDPNKLHVAQIRCGTYEQQ